MQIQTKRARRHSFYGCDVNPIWFDYIKILQIPSRCLTRLALDINQERIFIKAHPNRIIATSM